MELDNVIDFNEFMNTKKILHTQNILSPLNGLRLLLENQEEYDMVSYPHVDKVFHLANITLRIDKNGRYFHDHIVEQDCDVMDQVKVYYGTQPYVNFKLSYIIGGTEYECEKVNEIVLVSLKNNRVIIRITFLEPPHRADWYEFCYRKFLMNPENRKTLSHSTIQTTNLCYMNGTCFPNK